MQPKYHKIRELLRERGIDGAIVSSPENFHYCAGFAGHQHTVSRQPGMSFAVMSTEDVSTPFLVTMDFEMSAFVKQNGLFTVKKYDTWVGVKNWTEISGEFTPMNHAVRKNPMDVLVETMNDMALADGTIGVELSYLPVDYYQLLRDRLPKATFVNISDLFVYARSIKTAEEILLFRELCRVADEAFTEVSKIVAIGVTELELAKTFRVCVTAAGFCVPSAWSMFSTGANGAGLGLPEGRAISRGDITKFDGGVNAGFDFYTTDTSRSWVTEGANPLLYNLKDRLYEAQRKMIAAANPVWRFMSYSTWVIRTYASSFLLTAAVTWGTVSAWVRLLQKRRLSRRWKRGYLSLIWFWR